MVDVAMVGAGQTPYGTHPAAMKDMWADAVRACFDTIDGDLAPSSVDEVFLGSTAFGGGQLGNTAAYLAEHAGMAGVPARRIENACASSDSHCATVGRRSPAVAQMWSWWAVWRR